MGFFWIKKPPAKIISSDEVSTEECANKTEYAISKATNSCVLKKDIAESSLRIERETNKKLIILKNQEIDRLNEEVRKGWYRLDFAMVWRWNSSRNYDVLNYILLIDTDGKWSDARVTKDYDKIAKIEQAIKKKYGEEAIQKSSL